jgi:colanic acid/amylovoran biosynthesis protein
MEFGNIGNFYVIDSLVREVRRLFPNAEVRTTFQMSDTFCRQNQLTTLPMKLYYSWRKRDLLFALLELFMAHLHRWFPGKYAITPFMKEVLAADFILDYSGDLWGDNANLVGKNRFFIGACKDLTAQLLGRRVYLIAGSPGPFKSVFRRGFARWIYRKFELVTNREPVSTRLLKASGFSTENTYNCACPAFLFHGASTLSVREDTTKNIFLNNKSKPVVGFILCGWNMVRGPFSRWPRDDEEYEVFLGAVEFIVKEIGVRVCLLSHANGFVRNPDFRLIHGRDYKIIHRLFALTQDTTMADDVFILEGIYTASETHTLVGMFDMLVSGRVHAALAGLSQCVPTVILDYGHEPKAHKLKGFAELMNVEDYVADPASLKDICAKIQQCWDQRAALKKGIQHRMEEVEKMARSNLKLIRLKEADYCTHHGSEAFE